MIGALVALALAAANPEPDAVIAAAPAADWRAIPAGDLIGFETPRGTMVLQLAPDFAPGHIAAIRSHIEEKRFDGGAITRVQENYVIQWRAKLPETGRKPTEIDPKWAYERPEAGLNFTPLGYADAFGEAGFVNGWPVARDPRTRTLWPVHCHAMVGVGRENPPDIGDGTELYTVIGHAPRQLDRNLAVVGRIIAGLSDHSSLPRGTGRIGFYERDEEHTPILRAYILPPETRFEYLDTASASFAAYRKARANRGAFFVRPAGTIDVCNVPVPIRKAK